MLIIVLQNYGPSSGAYGPQGAGNVTNQNNMDQQQQFGAMESPYFSSFGHSGHQPAPVRQTLPPAAPIATGHMKRKKDVKNLIVHSVPILLANCLLIYLTNWRVWTTLLTQWI